MYRKEPGPVLTLGGGGGGGGGGWLVFFFFNDTATTEIYTLSLHDALPISNYVECEEGQQATHYWARDPRHHHLANDSPVD